MKPKKKPELPAKKNISNGILAKNKPVYESLSAAWLVNTIKQICF
jgi:hypothetical protein